MNKQKKNDRPILFEKPYFKCRIRFCIELSLSCYRRRERERSSLQRSHWGNLGSERSHALRILNLQ